MAALVHPDTAREKELAESQTFSTLNEGTFDSPGRSAD